MESLFRINISAIIFFRSMGVLTEIPIDMGWKPVDEIWLIMKSIFEER